MITLPILLISFIGLIWSANQLVTGAAGLALYYRLPSLLTGFTLVALGTSAPEIIVAISASLEGLTDMAIGNTIGSNIANIGLVLGLTALRRPLTTHSKFLQRDYPLLFTAMLFSYCLIMDGYLSIIDGCLLLLACLSFITYLIYISRHDKTLKNMVFAFHQAELRQHSIKIHLINTLLGLIILPLSAKYLISSSVMFAHQLGISELIISLTIVAIGSSLPELITSIIAINKGADDIAIGNIIGSNIFNLLAVMAFPGILHPAAVNHAILWRDIPVMFGMTLLLLWISYHHKKKITRWHGGLMVLVYSCYIISLVVSAIVKT